MGTQCDKNFSKRTNSQLFKWVRDIEETGKCAIGANGANMAQSTVAITSFRRESQAIAFQVGSSSRVVERIRAILRHASQGTIEKVENGCMSINQAYNEVIGKRQNKRVPLALILRDFLKVSVCRTGFCTGLNSAELMILGTLYQRMTMANYLSQDEYRALIESMFFGNVSQFRRELLKGVKIGTISLTE